MIKKTKFSVTLIKHFSTVFIAEMLPVIFSLLQFFPDLLRNFNILISVMYGPVQFYLRKIRLYTCILLDVHTYICCQMPSDIQRKCGKKWQFFRFVAFPFVLKYLFLYIFLLPSSSYNVVVWYT